MKKNKDIIMFSIDSSTKKTGIVVWKNGKYFNHYLINYDEKDRDKDDPTKSLCKTMNTRYPLMLNDILALLNEYQPYIIYIEEEVVTRNMDTCRFLFRLQGAIECWALEHNCEFNTVRPTMWRKACNFNQGKGHNREDLKKQSIQYVKSFLNIDVTDDEADAFCVGMYALKLFNIQYGGHYEK